MNESLRKKHKNGKNRRLYQQGRELKRGQDSFPAPETFDLNVDTSPLNDINTSVLDNVGNTQKPDKPQESEIKHEELQGTTVDQNESAESPVSDNDEIDVADEVREYEITEVNQISPRVKQVYLNRVTQEGSRYSLVEENAELISLKTVPRVGEEMSWSTKDGVVTSSRIEKILNLRDNIWIICTQNTKLLIEAVDTEVEKENKEDDLPDVNLNDFVEKEGVESNVESLNDGKNDTVINPDPKQVVDTSSSGDDIQLVPKDGSVSHTNVDKDFYTSIVTKAREEERAEKEGEEKSPESVSDEEDNEVPIDSEVKDTVEKGHEKIIRWEEGPGREKYFKLKHEFKVAQKEFYDVLDGSYKFKNIIGIGRNELDERAKEAYDKFMEANQAFYEYSKTSETNRESVERYKRRYENVDNEVSTKALMADRHVIVPAEQRLKHQSFSVSRFLGAAKLKDKYREKFSGLENSLVISLKAAIRKNPDATAALGKIILTSAFVTNAPATIAAFVGNWVTDKWTGYVGNRDKKHVIESFDANGDPDLAKYGQEHFNDVNKTQIMKSLGRGATLGATLGAGFEFSEEATSFREHILGTPDAILNSVDSPEIKKEPDPQTVQSESKKTFIPKQDDVESGFFTPLESSPATEASQSVGQETVPVPVENNDPLPEIKPKSETVYEPLSETGENYAQPDNVKPELYKPEISNKILEKTQVFNGSYGEMHNELYQILEKARLSGDITLPPDTEAYVAKNTSALYGFIEEQLPEVSRSLFDWSPDVATSNQWKEWGISSGDPTDIKPGEVVKIGKVVDFILKRSAESYNEANLLLEDLVDSPIVEENNYDKDGSVLAEVPDFSGSRTPPSSKDVPFGNTRGLI